MTLRKSKYYIISAVLIGILLFPKTEISDKSLTSINNERIAIGVKPLELNSKLTKTAQRKAEDIVTREYFSHTDPDGKYPWGLMHRTFYIYTTAGENLSRGASDEVALSMWMESEEHRENILNPKFREIGIGRSGDVIVHHFGARLTSF